jgi:hypothetical protein
MEARMSDVKDLLDEAAGSYEPRMDEGAVERRAERHRRTRRVVAGFFALGVFMVAAWFSWSAFRPVGNISSSTDSGTYLLTGFEVAPHIDPITAEIDPTSAVVTFTTNWSSSEYPGVHHCDLQVLDATGSQVGSRSFKMLSLSQGHRSPETVPIDGSLDGATATGSCSYERLDTPVEAVISDIRVKSPFKVSFIVGWPDTLPEGRSPGANACTTALFAGGELVAQQQFTLVGGDGRRETYITPSGGRIAVEDLEATLVCVPYVHEDEFPDPTPISEVSPSPSPVPVPTGDLPEAGVVVGTSHRDVGAGSLVTFIDLDGKTIATLRGYDIAGNTGSPGVWLQRGRDYFLLDVDQGVLVPVSAAEARVVIYDEGKEPQLAPPPAKGGQNSEPLGHWRYAYSSPSGVTLAQWSGECEAPTAYWIDESGTARIVTGERSVTHAPESLALGWSPDQRAVLFLPEGACSGSGNPPGIYLYSTPGVGKLIFETDRASSARMWGPLA